MGNKTNAIAVVKRKARRAGKRFIRWKEKPASYQNKGQLNNREFKKWCGYLENAAARQKNKGEKKRGTNYLAEKSPKKECVQRPRALNSQK